MIDTWRCLYNVMARLDRAIGRNTMEIAMARSSRAMTARRESVLERAGISHLLIVLLGAPAFICVHSRLNLSAWRPINGVRDQSDDRYPRRVVTVTSNGRWAAAQAR
jgi:hypothetical protein